MKMNSNKVLMLALISIYFVSCAPSNDMINVANLAWKQTLIFFEKFADNLQFTACKLLKENTGQEEVFKPESFDQPLTYAFECDYNLIKPPVRFTITKFVLTYKEIPHPLEKGKNMGTVMFGYSYKCQRGKLQFTETIPIIQNEDPTNPRLSEDVANFISTNLLLYFKALDGLVHTMTNINDDLKSLIEQIGFQRVNNHDKNNENGPDEQKKTIENNASITADASVKPNSEDIIDTVTPLVDLFNIQSEKLQILIFDALKDKLPETKPTLKPPGELPKDLQIIIEDEVLAFGNALKSESTVPASFEIEALYCVALPQRPEHAHMGPADLLIIFSPSTEKIVIVAKSSYFRINTSISAPLRNFILFNIQHIFEKIGSEIFEVVQHLQQSRLSHHNISKEVVALIELLKKSKPSNNSIEALSPEIINFDRLNDVKIPFGQKIDFLIRQEADVLFFGIIFKPENLQSDTEALGRPSNSVQQQYLVFYYALPAKSQYNLLLFLQAYIFEMLDLLEVDFDIEELDHDGLVEATGASYFKPTKRKFFKDIEKWIICDPMPLEHTKVIYDSSVTQFIVERSWQADPSYIVYETATKDSTESEQLKSLRKNRKLLSIKHSGPLMPIRRDAFVSYRKRLI